MSTEVSHLLVVDDEENNRDMLSRRLKRAGYTVDSAAGGREALEQIQNHEYDLVLLDHMMPDITGLDLLRLLRATYSPEQLPIIMVTAVNESEKVVEAIGLGANDYVTKPLDYPVTLARIRAQLSRKMAGSALREREERYALAAKGTNEGLWDWDIRSHRIYYSSRWKEMLGFAESEVGDGFEEWLERVPQPDRSQLWAALETYWNSLSATPVEFEHRMTCKDGATVWFLSRGVAVRDHKGRATRMVGSSIDITAHKAYDRVTKLPNRIFLQDCLSRALAKEGLCKEASFTTIYIDLDRFKIVNESLGHAVSDNLLLQVGQRLRQVAGQDRVVTYVEEDEFVVLYEGGDEEAARVHAQELIDSLRLPFLISGNEFVSSASAGIVISESRYTEEEQILRDANTAMYLAQAQGGARCLIFDRTMQERAMAVLELELDLPKAVERCEFIAYYQPKVRLSDNKIVGFEALIRWQHPTRGLVPPSDFIPIAERSGVIKAMGRWMIRESCRQLRIWNESRPADDQLKVSVNVSPVQFSDEGLIDFVRDAIESCGIRPECLDLEITEGSLVNDVKQAVILLGKLKDLGVGLKLDDFGTGYSALSYLRKLPFDTLKIDQSFVRELFSDGKNQELVKTILSMAHDLGMDSVAEGVETSEQAKLLSAMDCQYGQGYLYSRPVPPEKAQQLLEVNQEEQQAA